MSTPLSSIPGANENDDLDTQTGSEPTLEVDEGDASLELETDPEEKTLTEAVADETLSTSDSGTPSTTEKPEEAESTEGSKRGRSSLALILGVLLLASVAINLKQSRDTANLEARQGEYEQALAAAVERIDAEAARADGAEAALDRVDSAVDVVNERVVGLQEALDALRDATVR